MFKLKGLVLKNGLLERVPSLPPIDRVASLVDDDCKLTPLSTSFWDMDTPTGVFTRAYEELHYLDMILCKAASAHMAKEFMERSQLEDLAKGYSVLDEAERQQQQHDDMMRGALGKVGFEEYQKQNSVLYNGVGLYRGHTVLDEIERQNEEFKKQHGWGASNSVEDEIERLQAESVNSLGLGSIGSALEEMERHREELVNSTRASEYLDPMETARRFAMGTDSDQRLASHDRVEEAARGFGEHHAADSLGSHSVSDELSRYAELAETEEKRLNPYRDLLGKIPETRRIESPMPLPHSWDTDPFAEERKRQLKRDDLQRELKEVSEAHLEINAKRYDEEQEEKVKREEDRRSQRKANRSNKWMNIYLAVITTTALLVTGTGLFFEPQEMKDFAQKIIDFFLAHRSPSFVLKCLGLDYFNVITASRS